MDHALEGAHPSVIAPDSDSSEAGLLRGAAVARCVCFLLTQRGCGGPPQPPSFRAGSFRAELVSLMLSRRLPLGFPPPGAY